MKTLAPTILLAIVFSSAGIARADEGPTCGGPLNPSESAFVQSVQKDLTARFPRATDAENAGYVRYTAPDDTGAISYANEKWVSDPTHPSQLWYDTDGRLMGADFSVPRPGQEPRPELWGIRSCRWFEFNGHVHYVLKDPGNGKLTYDKWVWNNDFVAAGGSLENPSSQTLVKLGRVPSASDIKTIFEFPTIWDLVVWLRPHPAGQLYW